MTERVLFVSNGHGEVAISARIAQELPERIARDHLALVGAFVHASSMRDVGPRRTMPSGGLIAMGNLRGIARDIGAGLLGHSLAQLRFLRGVQQTYAVAVAVGDVFALVMALCARACATVYVGTAKSLYVAPYGPLEQRVIRRAQAVFVRDRATAERLRRDGIPARAANVIVDLYARANGGPIDAAFDPCVAVFPGSREAAYADAVALCAIVRELARERSALGAMLSVAPGLDAARMGATLARDGWDVRPREDAAAPFSLYAQQRELVRAWRGSPADMLREAVAVLGQAGTANEAAAAAGIPVVAYERTGKYAWYRKRQIALLGEALLVVSGDERSAAQQIAQLIVDDRRRARMGRIGRERMGPAGGAAEIAAEIVRLCR